MLKRELYIPPSDGDNALWLSGCGYTDAGSSRIETIMCSDRSDVYKEHKYRTSNDNGKTWTDFRPLDNMIFKGEKGGMVVYGGNYYFDAIKEILYHPVMRRIWHNVPFYTMPWDSDNKHPFYDHTFIVENGNVEKLMKYESGSDWDVNKYPDLEFLKHNMSYLGNSVALHNDGTAFFPMICNTVDENENWTGGVVLMRRDVATGDWTASNQQHIDPILSSRGLQEPDAVVLNNNRILIVCRGSSTATTPGRKWFTISDDNGKSIAPVMEFRHDDGTSFYSPSSIHRFIRSSKNGRLYWLANIVSKPPSNGRPRYPLCICEIDEEKTAVKKETVTVVDDRCKNEPELLQLSNFHALENRESLNIEIYMPRLGEDPARPHYSGIYKYVFSP